MDYTVAMMIKIEILIMLIILIITMLAGLVAIIRDEFIKGRVDNGSSKSKEKAKGKRP